MTRAQMAVFLIRATGGGVRVSGRRFDDTRGHWAEPWINEAARRGYTAGCAPSRFCPGAPVQRQHMASFLVRALLE